MKSDIDRKSLQRLVTVHLKSCGYERGVCAGDTAEALVMDGFEEPHQISHQLGAGMAFAAGVDFALEIVGLILNNPAGDTSKAIKEAITRSRRDDFSCRHCVDAHSMILYPDGKSDRDHAA